MIIRGVPRSGATPPGALRLAGVESPAVRDLLRLMLVPSDNFFAEVLLKRSAAERSAPGTTAAGGELLSRLVERLSGRPATLVDGSWLDPRDRASARQVTAVLRGLRRRRLTASLPKGGEGTLRGRLTRGAARGCQAKTGTAGRASALSGVCRSRRGRPLVFSILTEGLSRTGARKLQDRLAQAIATDRR